MCESYPGRISDALFLENEEATLKVATDVVKPYVLAVNHNTVRLHNEFFGTSCPHRSWDLHVGKNAPYITANISMMKDYFIKRIKHYYDGGKLKVNKSEIIKQEDVKQKVKHQEEKQVVQKTDWNKNKYGTWWKNEQASFKNGSEEIQVWTEGPFRIKGNEAGKLQPGTIINYDEVMLQDGHVWVGYDSFEEGRLYLPVREWNGVAPPNHGIGELWETIK